MEAKMELEYYIPTVSGYMMVPKSVAIKTLEEIGDSIEIIGPIGEPIGTTISEITKELPSDKHNLSYPEIMPDGRVRAFVSPKKFDKTSESESKTL